VLALWAALIIDMLLMSVFKCFFKFFCLFVVDIKTLCIAAVFFTADLSVVCSSNCCILMFFSCLIDV
jgi:hypothetical protein